MSHNCQSRHPEKFIKNFRKFIFQERRKQNFLISSSYVYDKNIQQNSGDLESLKSQETTQL